MPFPTLWNVRSLLFRLRQRRLRIALSSPRAVRTILERERDRSHRYGTELSLVLFDLVNIRTSDERFTRLTHVLARRKRSTDELGWFDPRHLVIILPHTGPAAAEQFVHDLMRQIFPGDGFPPYRIYQYPSQAPPPTLEDSPPLPHQKGSEHATPSAPGFPHLAMQDTSAMPALSRLPFGPPIPPWKRLIDLVAATLLLLLLLPLFLVIATFIKIASPGPVFFKQKRLGYLGKPFLCWKFRTMRVDADTHLHRAHLNQLIQSEKALTKLDSTADPRIIPFGSVLRLTGLDELPQLFNVVRGEMSLVGPRPALPYEAHQYLPWQTRRWDTVPGLTGLWQVSGKNRTTFKEMIRLDISYVKTRSFLLDLKIFFKTLPAIICQVKDSRPHDKASDHGQVP